MNSTEISDSSERKLAAIMFTDIVGYTTLMGNDETSALELLRKSRAIQQKLIAKHHGRWLKEMGDGVLAQFTTAYDSTRCAIEIQRSAQLELDCQIRVGIHLGDVTIENEDVFGDGVNIASRLQHIADPGGIYVSESIQNAIRGRSDIELAFLGEVQLKNVSYPVKTYYVKEEFLPIPTHSKIKDLVGNSHQKVSISSAVIAAVAFLAGLYWFISENSMLKDQETQSSRIAVLAFDNSTGKAEYDLLGKAASDWLSHGIVENNIAKVISPEIIDSYRQATQASIVPGSGNLLNDHLSPDKIIKGNIFLKGVDLIFKCVVSDGKNEETIFAFEDVVTNTSEPLSGLEKLKGHVLSYLATEETPELKLQEDPPIYEAYVHLLEAKSLESTDIEFLHHLEKAVEIDSTYFEPKVLMLSYYYNLGKFGIADSLRKLIQPNSKSNFRQVNLLNFGKSLLAGKNKLIYETYKNEYNYAPFDLPSNKTMMVLAQQFVFQPKEIDQYYQEINMETMDIASCFDCIDRLHIKAVADIELNKYNDVISLLSPHRKINMDILLLKPLISAYIRSQNDSLLMGLITDLPNLLLEDDWQNLYVFVAKEYLLMDNRKAAISYLDEAINYYQRLDEQYLLALAYFYKENYEEARDILDDLHEIGNLSLKGKSYLSVCFSKLGQEENAKALAEELVNTARDFDFGDIEYNLAIISAYKGARDSALEYLLKAVQKGCRYGFEAFQNDPAFKSLAQEKEFQHILTYWH